MWPTILWQHKRLLQFFIHDWLRHQNWIESNRSYMSCKTLIFPDIISSLSHTKMVFMESKICQESHHHKEDEIFPGKEKRKGKMHCFCFIICHQCSQVMLLLSSQKKIVLQSYAWLINRPDYGLVDFGLCFGNMLAVKIKLKLK